MSAMAMFEEALRNDPHDRQSWTVYADWLLQCDDARGKLIQLEHRLLTCDPYEDTALREQLRTLKRKHSREWFEGWPCPPGVRLYWRFGFICGVSLTGEDAVAHLASLVSHPAARLLGEVSVHDLSKAHLTKLLDNLGRSHVRTLRILNSGLGLHEAKVLASAEVLRPLTALQLYRNPIGAMGTEALAESMVLGTLVSLDLQSCKVGDSGVGALAVSETLSGLKQLVLGDNGITSAGIAALAATRTLCALADLDLSGNDFGSHGLELLARSESLRSLEKLDVRRSVHDNTGWAKLGALAACAVRF